MTEEFKKLRLVELYTDGACSGNPGPGGWAYILRDGPTRQEREGSGGEGDSTNNRMELMAVIQGLRALTRPCQVELHADSNYVLQGMQSWMAGWKKNGWKRRDGRRLEEVKNVELWQALDEAMAQHTINFHHVRGHTGHPENERCDVMAVEASQKFR